MRWCHLAQQAAYCTVCMPANKSKWRRVKCVHLGEKALVCFVQGKTFTQQWHTYTVFNRGFRSNETTPRPQLTTKKPPQWGTVHELDTCQQGCGYCHVWCSKWNIKTHIGCHQSLFREEGSKSAYHILSALSFWNVTAAALTVQPSGLFIL